MDVYVDGQKTETVVRISNYPASGGAWKKGHIILNMICVPLSLSPFRENSQIMAVRHTSRWGSILLTFGQLVQVIRSPV